MRPLHLTLASIIALSPLTSGEEPSPARTEAIETALDNLLSERDSLEAFEKHVAAAKKIGVSDQAILEARFLYHVDLRDDAAIAAMLPTFEAQKERFDVKESVIFATREDWLAVVEYVHAIAALQKGDRDGFKEHIKEAFWLGPRQAAAFAPHIERLRLDEAMADITIDFNAPRTGLKDMKPVTLKPHMKGKKALVLHFWSPHSTECEVAMADFAKTCEMLNKHDIAVASISAHHAPRDQKLAIAMAKPHLNKDCCLWLVETMDASLGDTLKIQNLPTMVIVSPEGKVLYNGEPTDEHFWNTLQKIDPKIDRPLTEGDYSQ